MSGTARSPFTPIANYGFLSNCHTGALVAPDGTVDWLCVPRFDSPSVFGALLDRGAGGFRFGPFGINVPGDTVYEPGTNTAGDVVEDTDGLGDRARRAHDGTAPRRRHGHPPHPTTIRRGRGSRARPDRHVHRRQRRDRSRVRARARLWPRSRRVDAERGSASRRCDRRRAGTAAADRHAPRHRSRPGSCPPRPARRRDGLLRPGLERGGTRPHHQRGGRRSARGHGEVLARLGRARRDSGPRARADDPALGADHQGPHVHADRRGRRGAHHLVAGDTRWGAELGLPVHLDPRLDLPSARAALPAPGLGGRRVHAVHGRPRAAATTAASRSCTGSTVAGI